MSLNVTWAFASGRPVFVPVHSEEEHQKAAEEPVEIYPEEEKKKTLNSGENIDSVQNAGGEIKGIVQATMATLCLAAGAYAVTVILKKRKHKQGLTLTEKGDNFHIYSRELEVTDMKNFYKLGYAIIAAGAVAVVAASFLNKRIAIVEDEE